MLCTKKKNCQDGEVKKAGSSAAPGGGFADFFLFEGETSRLLVCRGTELDFYDNGRAGEKDVTDSNQVVFLCARVFVWPFKRDEVLTLQ